MTDSLKVTTSTELYGHPFMLLWRLFEQEAGACHLPRLRDSCSPAHQPNGKSESSVTETF